MAGLKTLERVRKLAEANNLTLEELASKSDIGLAYARDWIRKERAINSRELEKIAKTFNINPVYLADDLPEEQLRRQKFRALYAEAKAKGWFDEQKGGLMSFEEIKRKANKDPEDSTAKADFIQNTLRLGLTNLDADYLLKFVDLNNRFIGGRYGRIAVGDPNENPDDPGYGWRGCEKNQQIDKKAANEELISLNAQYRALGVSESIIQNYLMAAEKIDHYRGWFPSLIC